MQNKNMWLFALVSFLIVFGWFGLQIWLHPPKKLDDKGKTSQAKKTEAEGWGSRKPADQQRLKEAAWLVGQGFRSGDADDLLRLSATPFALPDPWSELSSPMRFALARLPTPVPVGTLSPHLTVLGQYYYLADLRHMATPTEKVEKVTLGSLKKDSKYHLFVTLTSRGAGVQKLELNKFKAANWLGRPENSLLFGATPLAPADVDNLNNGILPGVVTTAFATNKTTLSPSAQVSTETAGIKWRITDSGKSFDAKLDGTTLNIYENPDLQLLTDDPYMASFLMYHYEDPKNNEVKYRPVSTLGDRVWKLDSQSTDGDDQSASFSTELPEQNVRIEKTYTLKPECYHLELSLKFIDMRKRDDPTAGEPTLFRYQLAGGHGLPIEGDWYTSTFRTAVMSTVDGNGHYTRYQEDSATVSHRGGGTSVPENRSQSETSVQFAGVMNQYFASVIVVDNEQANKEAGKDALKFLHWARPTLESTEEVGRLLPDESNDTIGIATPKGRLVFFQALPSVVKHVQEAKLKPDDEVTVNYYETSKGEKVATWVRRGKLPRPELDDITVRVHSRVLELRPGDPKEHRFLLYHGPAKVSLLYQLSGNKSVAPDLINRYQDTLNLRTMTDFGRLGWWSDVLMACTKLMHHVLYYLRFFGDGLSILMLTALVRGLMFPISRKQAVFSVRMQQLAPEMKKIQEKFKDDPKAKTEATMELYRKHHIHPLGGCLPVVLQMPIFIGLYFALQESIHFRLASFLWMDNLAAPDMLYHWGDRIPWISNPDYRGGMLGFLYLGPFFNLLPAIAVVVMIVQQKVMTPPPQDEQQAAQFKMMRYMMVFFGLMFYKVAAGLCMYIIMSTLWGLAERQLLPKKKPILAGVATRETQIAAGPPPTIKRKKQTRSAPPKKDTQITKVLDWWQDVLKQARKK